MDLYRILQIIKSGTTNYSKNIQIYRMRLNYGVSCIIEAVDLYRILQILKVVQLIIVRVLKYIVCA